MQLQLHFQFTLKILYNLPNSRYTMYRAQPFLKQVSKLSSRRSILSISQPSSYTPKTLFLTRASSTTGSNSSFDDYDSIMRTKSCNATSSNYSSSSVDIDNSLSTSASTSDDDISYASSSDKICTSQVSYCPTTIDTHETASPKEDYDRYELHHRPCEKTQVSYYDTSWGLGLGW